MNHDNSERDAEREKTEELLTELIKRGATMEQIALLKDPTANSPEEALRALKMGNARFLSGASQKNSVSVNERRAQIMTQTPFAVVLGCSDSRVPTEIVFDVGPGDIFSIRVAGNVVSPGTLGSVEYAIDHLKVHLLVILGHEGCGAVEAAMQPPAERAQEPEYVRFVLDQIVQSVDNLPEIRDSKARMREAIVRNVWHQKTLLESNPVVSAGIASGKLRVVGGYYSISSGAVDFLE
ncbi:MAG TPA: carbonic anhydrase [Abditibacteriaceae bacterium]|jgi:carbonic anhydrase